MENRAGNRPRWWEWAAALLLCWTCLGIGAVPFRGRALSPASAEASAALREDTGFQVEVLSVSVKSSRQRRVYIYHTHTFEAYQMDPENRYEPTETWRTSDHRYNVVRVGEELAAQLRNAGIFVTHDDTAYELPRLSSAYSRSLEGLKAAAEAGYDLYIDLHRDSYSKGNGPNTIPVEGRDTARLLFLVGQGTGSSLDEKPDWEANRQAAQLLSDALNARAEGLCRGVSLKSGRYNQQAASPCILIEVGNNQNTLPEALAAAEPLARAICQYFDSLD